MAEGSGRPSYRDLVILLREAPTKQMVTDQRFWDWRVKLDALLERIPEHVA